MNLEIPVSVSIKPAMVGAAGAIGGGLWAAVVSPDVVPVIGGIGIGIIGIGWSIFASGRDRRVTTLTHELEVLRRVVEQQEIDLGTCRAAKIAALKVNESLEVKIARLEAIQESSEHDQITH